MDSFVEYGSGELADEFHGVVVPMRFLYPASIAGKSKGVGAQQPGCPD
jgi:hypothetical protein